MTDNKSSQIEITLSPIRTEMELNFYVKVLNLKDIDELKSLVNYLHNLLSSLE